MKIKRFIPRILILSAAVASAVSLSACASGGMPIKSNIPEIKQLIHQNTKMEDISQGDTPGVDPGAESPEGQESGLVTQDGVGYYYVNGELQRGGIVGSETDGYFFANDDGVIDFGYCDGVNSGGVDWVVIEGKATQAETESDKVLFEAAKMVAKCTDTSMTRDEKLRACFDHLKDDYLEGVRHDPPYQEEDWPVLYANDIFIYGKGDCFSYGAAFAYIGKALGYSECYACNSGGHGWAEIEGKFYDPEWDMHHNEYNHFGVLPDDPNDVDYSGSLTEGVAWMHVLI